MEIATALTIITMIIILGLGATITIYLVNKKYKIDIPPDCNLCLNFNPERSEGHALGVEYYSPLKDSTSKTSDRTTYQFYPIDRAYNKDGDLTPTTPKSVPVSKTGRIELPKGYPSSYRNLVIYLPEHAHNLPRELIRTPFGQLIALYIETKKKAEDYLTIAVTEGSRTTQSLASELQQGELRQDMMARIDEFTKSMAQNIIETRTGAERKLTEPNKPKTTRTTRKTLPHIRTNKPPQSQKHNPTTPKIHRTNTKET